MYQPLREQGVEVVGVYGGVGPTGGYADSTLVDVFRAKYDLEMPLRQDLLKSLTVIDWPHSESPFPREVVIGPEGTIVYLSTRFDLDELLSVIEEHLP